MFRSKQSPKKLLIAAWILVATLYTLFGLYRGIKVGIIQYSFNQGRVGAIAQVIQEAQKCQPFPVNVGEQSVTLVSLECLQQAQQAATEETK